MKMYFIAVFVLLGTRLTVNSGSDESLCRGASGGSGSDESLCRGASGGSVAGLPNNYQDEPHDEDPAAQGGGLPINHQSVNKRLLKDEKEKKGSDWSLFMREIDRFWSRSRPRNRRSRPNASCVNKRLLKDEKEKKGSEGSLFMREIDRFWSKSRPRNRSSSPGPSFDEGAAAPGVLKHFLDEKEEKGSEGSLFMREIDRFYV